MIRTMYTEFFFALFFLCVDFALALTIDVRLVEAGPLSGFYIDGMWRVRSRASVYNLITISGPRGLQCPVVGLVKCTTRVKWRIVVKILSYEHLVPVSCDSLIQPCGVD